MDPNDKKQPQGEKTQINSEDLRGKTEQPDNIITDLFTASGSSKQSAEITALANKGIDTLKESLIVIKPDELAINDHIYAEDNKLKPVKELDYWDDKKSTTPEAKKIYTELRNNGFSHQEIVELSEKSRTEDFQSYLKNKIVAEQNEIKRAVDNSKTDINKIKKSVKDFFTENKAETNQNQTPSIFIGRYFSALLAFERNDNSGDYLGEYHPVPDAVTVKVPKEDIESGHLSEDLLHAVIHEHVHAQAGGFAQEAKPFDNLSARKSRGGFMRSYGKGDEHFRELNEGTTELIARKIAERSGTKTKLANHPYNQYVDAVENMLEHFAARRKNSTKASELQTLVQRYSRKTGLLEFKRDLTSMYGKSVSAFPNMDLNELVKAISENDQKLGPPNNSPLSTLNSNIPGEPKIDSAQFGDKVKTSSSIVRGSSTANAPSSGPEQYFSPTSPFYEESLETTIEQPGAVTQEKDDNKPHAKTHSSPSPSYRPARILSRQFSRRPIKGFMTRSGLPGGGSKMFAQLGKRAAMMAAQGASRLLMNPYVLAAIGILIIIFLIINFIIFFFTEKKPAGEGLECPPQGEQGPAGQANNPGVPMVPEGLKQPSTPLPDAEVRAQLGNKVEIKAIPPPASVNGIRQNVVCGILNFQRESGLNNIVITSGTDGKHSTTGEYTHGKGWKLDLRIGGDIDKYITSNYRRGKTRGDGAALYFDIRGNEYYRESNHWDVSYEGNNCNPSANPQINDPASGIDAGAIPPQDCYTYIYASDSASQNDCNGPAYKRYMQANPHDKSNWGDPQCTFTKELLKARLEGILPQATADLFYRVAGRESTYIPVAWVRFVGNVATPDPGGAWGLYQMGSRYGRPNGPLDHGDTIWQNQITNAVGYLRRLKGDGGAYWDGWRRLAGRRVYPI